MRCIIRVKRPLRLKSPYGKQRFLTDSMATEIRPATAGEYFVVTKARDAAGSMAKTEYLTFTVTKQAALTVKGVFPVGQYGLFRYACRDRDISRRRRRQIYVCGCCQRKRNSRLENDQRFQRKTQVELKYADMGTYQLTGSDNFELKLSVKDASGKTADTIYSLTVTSRGKYELPVIPVR